MRTCPLNSLLARRKRQSIPFTELRLSFVSIILIYLKFKKLATGIEPVTSSLPMRCATDCATPACLCDLSIISKIIIFVKRILKNNNIISPAASVSQFHKPALLLLPTHLENQYHLSLELPQYNHTFLLQDDLHHFPHYQSQAQSDR